MLDGATAISIKHPKMTKNDNLFVEKEARLALAFLCSDSCLSTKRPKMTKIYIYKENNPQNRTEKKERRHADRTD